jgi:hypothetical protein
MQVRASRSGESGGIRPATPILPPLMAPQQPSWKQEARQEISAAGRRPKPEAKSKTTPDTAEKPEGEQPSGPEAARQYTGREANKPP